MQLVLIVVLLFVTLALIGIILIQKSEGGTSGLTSGGGMGGMMSARSATNFLTRTTAILAAIFMGLCLLLAIMASRSKSEAPSILDHAPTSSVASSAAETPS
jgi:preprotein translocase subunit SecG